MTITDCTAALLCGGKSRRMGFDKARLQDGRGGFLIAQNAEKLGEVFAATALVAAQGQNLAGLPGTPHCTLWRDCYPETGPLGGVCTALQLAKTPWVFVLACDMPQPDMTLARILYAEKDGAQVVLFRREGRLEPLFAFYHQSCLPVFQSQLAAGQLRLRGGFHKLRVRVLELPSPQQGQPGAFLNLNTPRDVAAWRESTGLRRVPQMVMIGSFGRNSGKTTLAAALVERWSARWPVYGLKVVSVDEDGGECPHGAAGCGLCTAFEGDFALEEELGGAPGKDTARLLRAGAKRVFLLKSKRSALPRAIEEFLRQMPQDGPVVCESNSLRGYVRPGVFLMATGGVAFEEEVFEGAAGNVAQAAVSGMDFSGKDTSGADATKEEASPSAAKPAQGKPSARAVAHLADAVLPLLEEDIARVLRQMEVEEMPRGGLRVLWRGSVPGAQAGTVEVSDD